MALIRFFTKSRFKLVRECPTKLYCNGQAKCENQSLDDAFLQTLYTEEVLAQITKLLNRDNLVIYHSAICYEQLLNRVDILLKRSLHIQLI